jgi:hypothetical protein
MRHSLNIMSGRTDRKRPVVIRMIHTPNSRLAMIRPTGLDSRSMERVDFTTVYAINNPQPVSIPYFSFPRVSFGWHRGSSTQASLSLSLSACAPYY